MLVAVTDAVEHRVVEYEMSGADLKQVAAYDRPIGVYSGEPKLSRPMDVAYVVAGGALQLFAIDGGDRLLRLR